MAPAKKGDTVSVHYTGKLSDGTVFDSSSGGEPVSFKLGEGKLIDGFESAVEGMQPGESKTVSIASGDAYGPHRDDHVLAIDRAGLETSVNPQVGQRLKVPHPRGGVVVVTVAEVTEDKVMLDANHPLAGKDLTFEIELVKIA